MRRNITWAVGAALLLEVFFLTATARAVITKSVPLREVIQAEHYIFTAKVERLDPEKPAVVLIAETDLKGQAPFRRLPIKLVGDREAQRHEHTPKLLKRLAPDLPLVVFARKTGARYIAFGYTNGTWFQMIGHSDGGGVVRWEFTHCEPYLRRTFKGTTAELAQVLRDGLAGTRAPPEPDPQEPPDLGPEVQHDTGGGPRGSAKDVDGSTVGRGGRIGSGPILAVIPTFVVLGPVALLAALFPAVFGGLALSLRRWMLPLSVASVNSAVYLAHAWFAPRYPGSWWAGPFALWMTLCLLTLPAATWLCRPRRALVQSPVQTAAPVPGRRDQVVLSILAMAGMVFVFYHWRRGTLLQPPWEQLLVISIVVSAGALHILLLRLMARRPAAERLPGADGIMLWTLVLACAAMAVTSRARHLAAGAGDVRVVWTFQPQERGAFLSSPLVKDGRIYAAAVHGGGLADNGAVYCLDRATGKVVWKFDEDGALLQVFSSPCLADGRLYVGEGLHEDRGCKIYCIDAASGRKLWHFETASHTESSPCVVDGRLFTGAGDDGVYCLDATTGALVWHFNEPVHIDANPIVVDGRLYVGSGVSRAHRRTEVLCLNAEDGTVVWRKPTNLPVWGSPTIDRGQVFFGLGDGKLNRSAPSFGAASGAVLALDIADGRQLWRCDVAGAVLTRPAIDTSLVYVGSNDRNCYAIDRRDGTVHWKRDLGSPVVAAPSVVGSQLYVVASGGRVSCLRGDRGDIVWTFDVAAYSGAGPQLLSTPAVVRSGSSAGAGERQRIYFGAGLEGPLGSTAALFCLDGTRP